jgi:ABC-type antimicrobial peptide transport system permease subunit
MTWRDLMTISTGNLWRLKLRSFLTISGVVIAIAAFVAMLSFGAGNKKIVTEQYDELGLFTTMQVYPPREKDNTDSTVAVVLDDDAIRTLTKIPGVNLAYPFNSFRVSAGLEDTTLEFEAQALPSAAFETKLFSQLVAGNFFTSDSSRQVMLTEEITDTLGLNPDSIIGRRIIISVRAASIDSGLAYILRQERERLDGRLRQIRFDSLVHDSYRKRVFYGEMNEAFKFFLNGYMNHRNLISDTFTVCGVLEKMRQGRRIQIKPIIIPAYAARRFSVSGFGDDPADLFNALKNGSFFVPAGAVTPR